MKQKGNFMLRKVMDEYALFLRRKTAEEINQVITLSEIAAYIYEHAPEVNTPDELAELVSKEYNEPKENVKDDVNMVLTEFKQMGLLEKEQKESVDDSFLIGGEGRFMDAMINKLNKDGHRYIC